jgi:hypothetical protein
MNLQEHIRRILKEETNLRLSARRRFHELDELLHELLTTYYSSSKICIYRNEYEFFEHITHSIIADNMYYSHFEHIDDLSEEWSQLYRMMEEYIKDNYGDKLKEYYHMNCGD